MSRQSRTRHVPILKSSICLALLAAAAACATEPSQQICTTSGRCFQIVEVGRQRAQVLPQAPVPDGTFTVVSYASHTDRATLEAATAEADSVASLAVDQHLNGSDRLMAIDQVTSVELTGPLKEGRLYYYRVGAKSPPTRFPLAKSAPAQQPRTGN